MGFSLILANQLHHIVIPNLSSTRPSPNPSTVEKLLVLEIGAGTGLVGLAAAAIWATNVTLTDLRSIVPGLEANVLLNSSLLAKNKGFTTCSSLDWHYPSHLTLCQQSGPDREAKEIPSIATKAQVILAADTIYYEAHPELLTNVVNQWLERTENARMLIVYPVRVAYLDPIRELWQRFEELRLVVEREGKEMLPEHDWDDEREVEWVVWK